MKGGGGVLGRNAEHGLAMRYVRTLPSILHSLKYIKKLEAIDSEICIPLSVDLFQNMNRMHTSFKDKCEVAWTDSTHIQNHKTA